MGLTGRHVEAVRKGARVSRGLSTRNQHPRYALLSLSYLSRPRSVTVPPFLSPLSLPSTCFSLGHHTPRTTYCRDEPLSFCCYI